MDDGRTWKGHGRTIPKSILDTKVSVRRHTKKIIFFSKKNKILKQKKILQKKNVIQYPILGGRDSTRALQSSFFQNPGGVPRAWRTKDERTDGRTKEILVSNLGYVLCFQQQKKIPYVLQIFFFSFKENMILVGSWKVNWTSGC